MPEIDRDYFARRADEERRAAARAGPAEARLSHALLAERFAAAAAALDEAGEPADVPVRRAIIPPVSVAVEHKTAGSRQSNAPAVPAAQDASNA